MDQVEQSFVKALGPNYQAHRPHVRFLDVAELDQQLSKESGRPRYRSRTYIEKIKVANNHAKDVFCQAATEEDQEQWPDEWARYQELKQGVENRSPSLKAIPGMNVAAYEELKALGLTNCELLAEYEGDLFEHARFKEIAKRIMEISDGIRADENRGSGREDVRSVHARQVQPALQGNRAGIATPIALNAGGEGEVHKSSEQAEKSFSYSFQVAV